MRHLHEFFDRIHGAERVRDVTDRHQPCSLVQQLLKLSDDQLTLVVDRRHPQLRALFVAQNLPRHDVRMMLESRDHHFIVRPYVHAAVRLRHQVDAFGGAAREDDFVRMGGVQEPLDLRPRLLVIIGGALAQLVHAAVNIRILGQVVVGDGVDHLPGFLAGRRVIQVNQWLAVDLHIQDGKILADASHIESSQGGRAHKPLVNRSPTICSTVSRSESTLMRSSTSRANATISMLRASSRGMPRACR